MQPGGDPGGAKAALVESLLARSKLALRSGATAAALADLEQALEAAFAGGDKALEAKVLLEIARARLAGGAADEAALCAEQAGACARVARAPALQADALLLEADLAAARGDGARSETRLRDAVRLLDEATDAARARGDAVAALELSDRARVVRDRLIQATAERPRSTLVAPRADTRARREREILEKLYEIQGKILEERDAAKVATLVLDGAIEAAGAERGFLLLAPEAEEGAAPAPNKSGLPGGLEVGAARNFDGLEVRRAASEVSRSIIERALATKRPIVVGDAAADSELSEHTSVRDGRLRAVLCVPFESKRARGVRGVLYLDNRFGAGTFVDTDLRPLSTFAGHAAIAVENARLHARSEKERAALDRARARAEELASMREAELTRTGGELASARARLDALPVAAAPRAGLGSIVGASRRMQDVYGFIEKVKDAEQSVLIRGESGTGKELVARAIHNESKRAKQPFVGENCAAIPETLLEAALFGAEPGAFTGAATRRAGLFELAGRGTIFLDEIGELSPSAQAKLLRVLQEKKVRRIGSATETPVEARVICATNRDLEAMLKSGQLREDLYYRLNVLSVNLPPLRDRREDVPLLIQKLLGGRKTRFSPEALRALCDYRWPGNVRELENELKRVLALKGELIQISDLSPDIARAGSSVLPAALGEGDIPTLDEGERRLILAALRAANGNKLRAAAMLGIPRGTLWHKLRRHKIDHSDDE